MESSKNDMLNNEKQDKFYIRTFFSYYIADL